MNLEIQGVLLIIMGILIFGIVPGMIAGGGVVADILHIGVWVAAILAWVGGISLIALNHFPLKRSLL